MGNGTANIFKGMLPNFKQSYSGENMEGKLGSGSRFKHLKNMLAHKPGIKDPAAVAAAIGRKTYGKAKFQHLAEQGKKRHNK
jgi:hypothetical protein